MKTDKATMRRFYRQERNAFVDALSEQDRKVAFSRVPTPLARYFRPGTTVAGYIAMDSEADPACLLAEAVDRGCITALPYVISRSAPMLFLRWKPGDPLESGPFGLLQPSASAEPASPEVLLVPLVAFDDQLMRLGQGAGYYDRALSLLESATAIGLSWSVQQAPTIEADPWDIPMDAILTEKAWITA